MNTQTKQYFYFFCSGTDRDRAIRSWSQVLGNPTLLVWVAYKDKKCYRFIQIPGQFTTLGSIGVKGRRVCRSFVEACGEINLTCMIKCPRSINQQIETIQLALLI